MGVFSVHFSVHDTKGNIIQICLKTCRKHSRLESNLSLKIADMLQDSEKYSKVSEFWLYLCYVVENLSFHFSLEWSLCGQIPNAWSPLWAKNTLYLWSIMKVYNDCVPKLFLPLKCCRGFFRKWVNLPKDHY